MTASTTNLTPRRYSEQDKVRLLELMRNVWSHKADPDRHVRERWWWQFPDPPLYVVEAPSGVLAGVCAYMPFTLWAGSRNFTAAWFVDFYVLAEYQGKGLGRRLTQAVEDRFEVTASLSQTAMAWRVFQKMGWQERVAVPMYLNPLPLTGVLHRSKDVTVSAYDGAALRPRAAELEGLWARVRGQYPVIAGREGSEVAARYANQQAARKYVTFVARRGGECVGYLVARVAAGKPDKAARGLIVDYLVHPDDGAAFHVLLGEAVSKMRQQGAGRIYCVSTVARHQRALVMHGFLSPNTPLLGRALAANIKWLTYHPRTDLDIPSGREWFLTLADCDLDYAWYEG